MHSGVTGGRAKRGMAIIMVKEWANYIKSWRFVSERCIKVGLNIAGVWLTSVEVYAPTDDSDSLAKVEFYVELQEVLNRAARSDRIVVMACSSD